MSHILCMKIHFVSHQARMKMCHITQEGWELTGYSQERQNTSKWAKIPHQASNIVTTHLSIHGLARGSPIDATVSTGFDPLCPDRV